jgi:hypothetical protein
MPDDEGTFSLSFTNILDVTSQGGGHTTHSEYR